MPWWGFEQITLGAARQSCQPLSHHVAFLKCHYHTLIFLFISCIYMHIIALDWLPDHDNGEQCLCKESPPRPHVIGWQHRSTTCYSITGHACTRTSMAGSSIIYKFCLIHSTQKQTFRRIIQNSNKTCYFPYINRKYSESSNIHLYVTVYNK